MAEATKLLMDLHGWLMVMGSASEIQASQAMMAVLVVVLGLLALNLVWVVLGGAIRWVIRWALAAAGVVIGVGLVAWGLAVLESQIVEHMLVGGGR